MIVVEGWAKLAAGELDRLEAAALKMIEETRKEEGCLSYAFSRAIEDPDVMRIAEVWKDQAALDAHMASPHMAEFNAVLGSAKIEGASIKGYDADSARQLMGSD